MAYMQPAQVVVVQQPQVMVMQQQPMVVYQAPVYNRWTVPVCDTCSADCAGWCSACMCPMCAIYQQRKRLLAFTGEPYSCFQKESFPRPATCCDDPYHPPPRVLPAKWPPADTDLMPGTMNQVGDFHWQICMETCCFPTFAMLINRRLMKYKFNILDGTCEKILTCGVLFGSVQVEGRTQEQDGCGGAVMACLLTQQDQELKAQEAKRMAQPMVVINATPGQVVPMGSPQQQTMQPQPMMMQQQQPMQQYPPQQTMQQYPPQQQQMQ